MRVSEFGDHALLVRDVEVLAALAAVRAALGGRDADRRHADRRHADRRDAPPVVDLVPTESSLLVVLDEAAGGDVRAGGPRTARAWLESVLGSRPSGDGERSGAGREFEIPVRYDGPDLDEVARLSGLTPAEVVAAHQARPWRVAFTGFAPGFAYLVGGDPRLHVPRRESPRPSVPAGSVGLAGHFSGIYPRASPGGWQLIGTTDAELWDVRRDPPALLQPGDLVRFRATVLDRAEIADHPPPPPALVEEPPAIREPAAVEEPPAAGRGAVTVEAAAPGATIQDGGRPGHAHVGVTRSGAADRLSLHAANRLVGNRPDAPAIEITLGGCALRADTDLLVAVCGAECPVWLDGRLEPTGAVLTWRAGTELRLGTATRGLRAYLAVRGGFAPEPVLGSAATDVLSGLGPAPLSAGTRLPVGAATDGWPQVETLARPVPSLQRLDQPLDVVRGPRTGDDPALARAFATLVGTRWQVGPASDRVGVRLSAVPGEGAAEPQSPLTSGSGTSDGLVRGAVQWPPGGDPVVFLADHPVTGGYPVVACLTGWGSDVLAQHRPGDLVSFRESIMAGAGPTQPLARPPPRRRASPQARTACCPVRSQRVEWPHGAEQPGEDSAHRAPPGQAPGIGTRGRPAVNRLEVDVLVLGAGGAGSALLLALDKTWQGDAGLPPRILVVDPVRRSGDDRTWCFWHDGPHDLDGLARRAWRHAEVVTAEGTRAVLDLDPFRYVMLRSSDVYAQAREAARRLGARWITGNAGDPVPHRDGAVVQVGDQVVDARWVFDSRPTAPARPAATAWIQHFRGWTVRFPEAAVDPAVPTLMDLSTPQQERAVTFGYVLPLEPDLALVEYTVFSPAGPGRWPEARYARELYAYLESRWGLEREAVRVEAVEDGVIPMSDAAFDRRPGRHVMRIGTAGGATRGSTGYAFAAMYRQARSVAEDLRAGRVPVPPPAYPHRHRVIDGILLAALDAGHVAGAELLGTLWTGHPPDRLLRFLDGGSSLLEEQQVMASAPRGPMTRAVGTWLARRSREALRPGRSAGGRQGRH